MVKARVSRSGGCGFESRRVSISVRRLEVTRGVGMMETSGLSIPAGNRRSVEKHKNISTLVEKASKFLRVAEIM